jgi:hypothetical protein
VAAPPVMAFFHNEEAASLDELEDEAARYEKNIH